MNSVLLTGWAGTTYALIACETVPLMHRYSAHHGISFACECMSGERPPPWMKIPLIQNALKTYEIVLWLDVDVVIERNDASIFGELPFGAWQALVKHTTECGEVPNTGVWLLTRDMTPILDEAWKANRHINHQWWEQAVILELMGYELSTRLPTSQLRSPTALHERTAFLDPTWNHHPDDINRVGTPRFRHVTQYPNRLGAVKDFVSKLRG